jgi:putative oxidoreductase
VLIKLGVLRVAPRVRRDRPERDDDGAFTFSAGAALARFEIECDADAVVSLCRLIGDLPAVADEAQRLQAPDELGIGEDLRALTLINLGVAEASTAGFEKADGHLREGVALAHQIGRPYLELIDLAHRAQLAVWRTFPASEQQSRQAIDLAEANGWADEPIAGVATPAPTTVPGKGCCRSSRCCDDHATAPVLGTTNRKSSRRPPAADGTTRNQRGAEMNDAHNILKSLTRPGAPNGSEMTTTSRMLSAVGLTARLFTGSTYAVLGYGALREPGPRAEAAATFLDAVPKKARLHAGNEQLVQVNGAIQAACGVLLALGKVPHLSAVVLAGTMIPTTLAGHSFWKFEDPVARKQQQVQFHKNMAMIGGLLFIAMEPWEKGKGAR